MPRSLHPSAEVRQLRLTIRNSACATLMDLQRQAVAAGLHKPSYSDLIEGAICRIDGLDVIDILEPRRTEGAA